MFRPVQIVTAIILTCLMFVVSTTSYIGLSYITARSRW